MFASFHSDGTIPSSSDKLNNYNGIRGHICKWFRHNSSDRQQCVSINGTVSEYAHVQTDGQQGSILGPVLFLLYINDNL